MSNTPAIESAADFAVNKCMHPDCAGGEPSVGPCCLILAGYIEQRDAAIRRATLLATADAIQKRADEQASGTLLRSEFARLARDIRAVAVAEAE